MYWVPYMAWANGSYWLSVMLMVVISMIVTFTWTFVQRTYFPQDYHIIQEQDVLKRKINLPEAEKPKSQLFAPTHVEPMRYSGYAYEPGDESRLSRMVRKSAKSPPVSGSFGPEDPSLRRSVSTAPLVNDDMNL